MNKIGTIYGIVNNVNGKMYIGSTIQTIKARSGKHFRLLKHNKHNNRYLQSSFNKYGIDAFVIVSLKHDIDESELRAEETKWITAVGTLDRQLGYNLIAYGQERCISDETRLKMSNSAKSISREVRKRMGESRKGSKASDKTKLKMSEAHKRRWNKATESQKHHIQQLGYKNKGVEHSQTRRNKNSEATKKRWEDGYDKMRRNLVIPTHKSPHTEETKEKIRLSKSGSKVSNETKMKMSEAHKRRWAQIKENNG